MSIQSQDDTLNNLLYYKAKIKDHNKIDCFIFASQEADKYKRKYKSYDDAIKAVRLEIVRLNLIRKL